MLFTTTNQKKQARLDDIRINIKEDYEVQFWSRRWGISPLQLETAVKAAGTNVARLVEEFLRKAGKI